MKIVTLVTLLAVSSAPACKSDEGGKDEDSSSDERVVESSPNTLAVGGLPSEDELGDAVELSQGEAELASQSLESDGQALPLKIAVDTEGAALTSGGGGQFNPYVFAKAFGDIYDMVTGAAQCNLTLLMKNADGSFRTPRKVKGRPVYFIDAFAGLGLGDGGVECPDAAKVAAWVEKNGLDGGDGKLQDNGDDEFYIPARLVLYKHKDGTFRWVVAYFPKDFMAKLAERVKFFKNFLDKDLDFIGYHGQLTLGEEVGEGKGVVTLNFNEIARMIALFNSLEDEDGGSNLTQDETQDESGEEEGMPSGQIKIDYDNSGDPRTFATTFLDDFSFGDDDDGPFLVGTTNRIARSGGENYLMFAAGAQILKSDNPDDPGPFANIRICNSPGWEGDVPPAGWDFDNQFPWTWTTQSSVAESDYLAAPSEMFIQIIWKDIPTGKSEPDDYLASLIATKGGPFIYGDLEIQAGKKDGTFFNGGRLRLPICDSFTPELINDTNEVFRDLLSNDDIALLDVDGFQNIRSGSGENDTEFLKKSVFMQHMPAFEVFQFADVHDDVPNPVKD